MAGKERMSKFKELIGSLTELFTIERVCGDPVEIQGIAIVPVVEVAIGGGGGGGGEGPVVEGKENEAPGEEGSREPTGYGSGMGFGFGGSAKPVGFLIVEEGKTRWLPITNTEKIVLKILGMVSMAIKNAGKLSRRSE